jgi:uncharacterized protein
VPQLLAGAQALIAAETGARIPPGPPASRGWIVGGASFGGRVASMAVAAQGGAALGVVGLLVVAYPLHPPGRVDELRVAHWSGIDVPALLLSGDADAFAQPGLLGRHVGAIRGGATLVLVAGAQHDLSVTARRDPHGRRRSPAESVEAHRSTLLAWAAAVSG